MNSFSDRLALLLLVVTGLMLLSLGIDWLTAKPVLLGPGTVKQMVYVPSTHSYGTATTLDKNSSTVMVSSSTFEEYRVVVTMDRSTFSVETTADLWGQLSVGAAVDVYEYQGRVFGGRFRRYVRLKE